MRERNRQREGEIFGVPKALFCLVGVFVGSFSPGISMEECPWGSYPWVSKQCSPPRMHVSIPATISTPVILWLLENIPVCVGSVFMLPYRRYLQVMDGAAACTSGGLGACRGDTGCLQGEKEQRPRKML